MMSEVRARGFLRHLVCSSHVATWCFTLGAALALVGCGGRRDTPALGEVTGKVTLDGQPLANAKVEFIPASGRPSFGESGADGSYRLEYTANYTGAVVGQHTVKIRTGGYSDAGEVPEKLPARYHDQSELQADVKLGSNQLNFDLQSK